MRIKEVRVKRRRFSGCKVSLCLCGGMLAKMEMKKKDAAQNKGSYSWQLTEGEQNHRKPE